VGGRPIPREVLIDRLSGVLLDVDGTLLTETGPIPGAAAVVERLRHRGFPSPFVMDDALEDLRDFELVGGTARPPDRPTALPDAVLVGDVGERWTHALLNEAFRYVMGGAQLVALQMGHYWHGPSGLEVDAGAYVAALEYATGAKATVCGKPNREFFEAAVGALGTAERRNGGTAEHRDHQALQSPIAMVGDDLWADIDGSQRAGLEGWLVRTGKFHEDTLATSGIRPDRVLDSVAELC
jgi:ribonucleotide monophosphatase NagD (HAD superfamily)